MHLLRTAASLAMGLLFLSAGALVHAQNIQSTPVPTPPKPDFSSMQFLAGTWECSIKSSRRPSAYRTTSTATMSPDGYWMVTRTTTHKASWISQEIANEDRLTYDASTKRWVDMSMGEDGTYDFSTSPGWNGNTIVWTDVAYSKTNNTATNNPTTMTKVSNTKTTSTSSFTEPSGRLVNVTTTCTKSS